MLTNREIGKLARAICKREGLQYGIRTNSYSEYRGGRRVKKYWMAFDSKRIRDIFLEEVKPYEVNPISKGYSYRIGYIVEIIKEVEEKAKPKSKKESFLRKEDLNIIKYGCKLKPRYKLDIKDYWGTERPKEIIVSEEEVSIVLDEILSSMWIKASVLLEVSEDGNMPFFLKEDVEAISELNELLREVSEERVFKSDYHYGAEISHDMYGARKNWKR